MKFALFLTQGTSLKLWKEKGWLDGGIGIKSYNRWADFFEKFYLVTYGGQEDLKFSKALRKNMVVLPKRFKLPSQIYGFLSPFIYRRELKEVDIFYSAQMEGAWSAVLAKFLFKKKFVLHCGYLWSLGDFGRFGRIKKVIAYFLEWITYKAADFIILTSEHAQKHVIKRYRINPHKIKIIRNPVDTDLFKPLDLEKAPQSLAFVGRLEKEKNPFSVVKAIKGLNITLTIFGRGSLEKKLRNYAKKHKIKVIFRGNISQNKLPKELNKNEMLIAPSFYEGSPKALLEAMSCGLAVIGTNVRGINEIIKHKENGYLCETSSDSIREAILKVGKDEKLRAKIGKEARKYILENCHLDKKIKKEIEIYKAILKP